MTPIHVIVLYLVSIPVVILAIVRRWGRRALSDLASPIAAFYIIIAILGGLLSPVTLEWPGPHEMTIERVNGTWRVVAVFPEEEWVWSWDKRVSITTQNPDRRLVSYASREIGVTMSIEPITPNPKVRETQYEITVEVGGSPQAMLDFIRSIDQTVGGWPKVERIHGIRDLREYDWLKYYLYEFNERHGREIGTLYNPINKDQQRRFSRLVADFLTPHLSPAQVQFKEANFWLKEP